MQNIHIHGCNRRSLNNRGKAADKDKLNISVYKPFKYCA